MKRPLALVFLFILLLAASGRIWGRPSRIAQAETAPGGNEEAVQTAEPLLVAGGVIDAGEAAQRTAVSVPGLFLVQFTGPIQESWLDAIRNTGAQLVSYVAVHGYLVWAEAESVTALQQLPAKQVFVRLVVPYDADDKVPAAWQQALNRSADTAVTPIVVQMLQHPGQAETEAYISRLAVGGVGDWEPVLGYRNVRVSVPVTAVAKIAARPDVVWVGPQPEIEMMDEVQGQILTGSWTTADQGVVPGYIDWLAAHHFSTNPQDYPIVDVADDGVGAGLGSVPDLTMTLPMVVSGDTRLVYVSDCTQAADGGSIGGHGHLNLSIAGGYDVRDGQPYQDEIGFQRGLGVNPYGRFGSTRIFSPAYDLSRCGQSETTLIQTIYRSGARISSNSWGCPICNTRYDVLAQIYDAGTRDADTAVPGNQEMLFVFAAGNNGPTPGTINSPGSAKNVLTVGASENVRPGWTDGCHVPPSAADNLQDIADFSSRGPAPGNRVKPEVVAPGTHVQGTASPNANYNGSLVCDIYYPAGQSTFASSSGTSHAAPAVAGAASLVTYWLQHEYELRSPSPAMLKAYLMAHTQVLNGYGAGELMPNFNQGFGMPNLSLAFDDTPRYLLDQSVLLDNSGDVWEMRLQAADPTKPVVVVMVYTDQPGLLGSAPQVNDLNLAVAMGTAVYHGNSFVNGVTLANGQPDRANNYEKIILPTGTTQPFSLTVTAFNLPGDGVPQKGDGTDQDFAVVCYNCTKSPDYWLSTAANSYSVCAENFPGLDIPVTVSSILGFSDRVQLELVDAPEGVAARLVPDVIQPPATSVLTVQEVAAGTYQFLIRGEGGDIKHSYSFLLAAKPKIMGAPAATAVVSTSRLLVTAVTFTWPQLDDAESYHLEFTPDPAFRENVTAVSVTENRYTLTDIMAGTRYYWRIRGENVCGRGPVSPIFWVETPALWQTYLPVIHR